MPFTRQTLTGRVNIYNAIVNFLQTDPDLVAMGENWSLAGSYNYGTQTGVYLQSPSIGGNQFYVRISHGYYVETDAHVIQFRYCLGLGTNYETLATDNTYQSEHISVVPVHDTESVELTLIASGRRFCGFVNWLGKYMNFYQGMFLPYVEPANYPYPILGVGAAVGYNQPLTFASHIPGGYWFNSYQNASVYSSSEGVNNCISGFLDRDGTPQTIQTASTSSDYPYRFFPYYFEDDNYDDALESNHYWRSRMSQSPGGYTPLEPIQIFKFREELFGELDGVRAIAGAGQIAGRIFTDELGNDWIVSQNGTESSTVYLTTAIGGQFCAYRLA